MLNSTWYITDLKTIQRYINELYKYDSEKAQMIVWQLVRYANLTRDNIVKRNHWDYKMMENKKIILWQDPLFIY